QDVESAPAADLQAPEPAPVEVPATEDEMVDDKLVDSEDLAASKPEAEVVPVSGDPIPDESAAIVEPVAVPVAVTDAPEPSPATQASDNVAASALPVEEPVSREIATDAADVETPVLEESTEVPAPGDVPEHVDPAIADSAADPVDSILSTDSEQREDLEMSSSLEPVVEQKLIEEVEVASEPRDLDVVESSEDKPTTEEASTLSDHVAVSVEEPVVAAAAASEIANVAESVDDAPSADHTSAEPVFDEPVVAERSIDEMIGSANVAPTSTTDAEEAAAEEPVEVAPISPEYAFAEPSSEEPVIDTPAAVEAEPNAAVPEDQVPAQPASDDVAERAQVPEVTEDDPETTVAPTERDVEDAKKSLEVEHNTLLTVDDAIFNEVARLSDEEITTADQIDSEPVTAVEARDPAMVDTPVASDADKDTSLTDSEPVTPVVEESTVAKEKLDIPSDAYGSVEAVPAELESKTPNDPVPAPKNDTLEPRSERDTAPEVMPEYTVTEDALSAEPATEKPGDVSDAVEQPLDAVTNSEEPLADESVVDEATDVPTLPTDMTANADPVGVPVSAAVQEPSESIAEERLVEEPEAVTSVENAVLDS
ncbi:hypothetical protein LPJ59_006025, partial [Coemansia sp. RSA 2399]